jgi:hypothetical protein
MKTCHHLHRRVLAYVAEHYDGDIEDEPTLHAALESVLGPRPQEPAEENPDVRVAALEMLDVRLAHADKDFWKSDPHTRDVLLAIRVTTDGITPASVTSTQHAQVRWDMVAQWLITCRDGAWDATSGLYRLMDDDEAWEGG